LLRLLLLPNAQIYLIFMKKPNSCNIATT